jgi:hypothetical protein
MGSTAGIGVLGPETEILVRSIARQAFRQTKFDALLLYLATITLNFLQ